MSRKKADPLKHPQLKMPDATFTFADGGTAQWYKHVGGTFKLWWHLTAAEKSELEPELRQWAADQIEAQEARHAEKKERQKQQASERRAQAVQDYREEIRLMYKTKQMTREEYEQAMAETA